jgi:hypothetical protein
VTTVTDFDEALSRLRSWADAAQDAYGWLFVLGQPPASVLEVVRQCDDELECVVAPDSLSHWRSWANGEGVTVELRDVAGRILELLEAAVAELVLARLEEGASRKRHQMAKLELAAALGRLERPVGVRPQVSHIVKLDEELLASEADEGGW